MYLLAYEPMPNSRPPMNGRTIRSLTRERRRERRSETKRLKAEGGGGGDGAEGRRCREEAAAAR
jgi:hypothetical protein